MTTPVPTQADRDAAARWAKLNGRHAQAANIRRGSCDDAPIVQAFAAHGRETREACARIADWASMCATNSSAWRQIARSEVADRIAAAIRNTENTK